MFISVRKFKTKCSQIKFLHQKASYSHKHLRRDGSHGSSQLNLWTTCWSSSSSYNFIVLIWKLISLTSISLNIYPNMVPSSQQESKQKLVPIPLFAPYDHSDISNLGSHILSSLLFSPFSLGDFSLSLLLSLTLLAQWLFSFNPSPLTKDFLTLIY